MLTKWHYIDMSNKANNRELVFTDYKELFEFCNREAAIVDFWYKEIRVYPETDSVTVKYT